MSNMKHDAIVEQGIPIYERIPIPDRKFQIETIQVRVHLLTRPDLIPNDSRVEIDAKINAGYFTTGKTVTNEELKEVKGRGWQSWEDISHQKTNLAAKCMGCETPVSGSRLS